MKKIKEYLIVFLFGGVLYGLIEVMFRGYTHWTMVLLGGTVLSLLYFLNLKTRRNSLFVKSLVGCAVISTLEFVCGYIVNIQLHLNVWDYSEEKFNLLGQICPKFAVAWFLLCIPAYFISDLIKEKAITPKNEILTKNYSASSIRLALISQNNL